MNGMISCSFQIEKINSSPCILISPIRKVCKLLTRKRMLDKYHYFAFPRNPSMLFSKSLSIAINQRINFQKNPFITKGRLPADSPG